MLINFVAIAVIIAVVIVFGVFTFLLFNDNELSGTLFFGVCFIGTIFGLFAEIVSAVSSYDIVIRDADNTVIIDTTYTGIDFDRDHGCFTFKDKEGTYCGYNVFVKRVDK